jgi:hypothetical protein
MRAVGFIGKGKHKDCLQCEMLCFCFTTKNLIFYRSSDASSGTVRLYDGRGGDKPLETIETLHRFPVHLMTVRTAKHLTL